MGSGAEVPADLVDRNYEFALVLFSDPANRGDDFADPVPIDDHASATDRLMAFLGRQP